MHKKTRLVDQSGLSQMEAFVADSPNAYKQVRCLFESLILHCCDRKSMLLFLVRCVVMCLTLVFFLHARALTLDPSERIARKANINLSTEPTQEKHNSKTA